MLERARYFPVLPRPLKMVAGLSRFGADFGQGALDQRYFQLDGERAHYLTQKRRAPLQRHVVAGEDEGAVAARAAALVWMRETLAREAPHILEECAHDGQARDDFDALARSLQEDFCVLRAGDDDSSGRAVLLDVRFPSGWRPERLANASFQTIHAPVPGFLSNLDAARSMVRAMVERGPFVRFVWTLAADDILDHHPDAPGRVSFAQARQVWLRVERQISVPLREARASVFLIRTYLYPAAALTAEQRSILLSALAQMPSEVRAYKNLPAASVLAALFDDVAANGPTDSSESSLSEGSDVSAMRRESDPGA